MSRSKKRQAQSLRRVAYHEAGHAVLHVLAGQAIESVTIVPTKDYLGETRLATTVQPIDNLPALMCLLAGPVAEALATGVVDGQGATGDLEQIIRLVQPFFQAQDRWYPIEWVAQGLLVKKSLTGDEVDALVRKAKLWQASQQRSIARITGRSRLF